MGPELLDDVYPVKESMEQASADKKHFDMSNNNIMSHYQIKGVNDVNEIDYDNDLEEDDDDDSLYISNILKQ